MKLSKEAKKAFKIVTLAGAMLILLFIFVLLWCSLYALLVHKHIIIDKHDEWCLYHNLYTMAGVVLFFVYCAFSTIILFEYADNY